MMFIERMIYNALDEGLTRMISKPELFEEFLLEGGLSADEASRGRAYFEDRPPEIIHGFARADGHFPCLAIVLGRENTDKDFIGEDAFDSYLEDPTDENSRQVYRDADGNRLDPHVRRWAHNYDLYIYVDHPDVVLYYYYLAKQILAESRTLFHDDDLGEFMMDGADLAPDPRYLPSGMFVRRLGLKFASDQVYYERRKPGVGNASQLAGAHVAEDRFDATGVDAGATISTE